MIVKRSSANSTGSMPNAESKYSFTATREVPIGYSRLSEPPLIILILRPLPISIAHDRSTNAVGPAHPRISKIVRQV